MRIRVKWMIAVALVLGLGIALGPTGHRAWREHRIRGWLVEMDFTVHFGPLEPPSVFGFVHPTEPSIGQWVIQGRSIGVRPSDLYGIIRSGDSVSETRSAVFALRYFGDEEVVPVLEHLVLSQSTDARIRKIAVNTLSGAPGGRTGRLLRAVFQNDPDIEVRMAVLTALEMMGTEEARELLSEATHDPDPRIRREATECLESEKGESDKASGIR